MKENRRKKYIIGVLLFVVVFACVLGWISMKQGEKNMYVEIGMSERQVFHIWGDPDETIIELDGTRSSNQSLYAYHLESGERLFAGFFDRKLNYVYLQTLDNTLFYLAHASMGRIGTQLHFDFSTGKYEVRPPNYHSFFEGSSVSIEQVCQIEIGMSEEVVKEILGNPAEIIEDTSSTITVRYIYYLNNNYQLVIRMLRECVTSINLNDAQGDTILTLLSGSIEGKRVVFDSERGAFYESYPTSSLEFISESDLLKLNNISKGMTEDRVRNELANLTIVERREGLSMYYFNSGSFTELIYEIDQNTTLKMLFNNNLLISVDLISRSDRYRQDYLLFAHDPIGTRIHYDPETGYISKEFPN